MFIGCFNCCFLYIFYILLSWRVSVLSWRVSSPVHQCSLFGKEPHISFGWIIPLFVSLSSCLGERFGERGPGKWFSQEIENLCDRVSSARIRFFCTCCRISQLNAENFVGTSSSILNFRQSWLNLMPPCHLNSCYNSLLPAETKTRSYRNSR